MIGLGYLVCLASDYRQDLLYLTSTNREGRNGLIFIRLELPLFSVQLLHLTEMILR